MTEASIKEQLTRNAVAFLLKAAEELGESPRYSLIHLCSGLELLIKARLAHEHWSLVLEKPGSSPRINPVLDGRLHRSRLRA